MEIKNFLLDIIFFTTHYTRINIADIIKAILAEFHLLKKILALTTNNKLAIIMYRRTIAKELALELNNQTF